VIGARKGKEPDLVDGSSTTSTARRPSQSSSQLVSAMDPPSAVGQDMARCNVEPEEIIGLGGTSVTLLQAISNVSATTSAASSRDAVRRSTYAVIRGRVDA